MIQQDNRGVHLLTYADRLGGSIAATKELLDGPLSHFTGVHLLPFFTPFDGDDTGFDPINHCEVDPRLGSWNELRSIAESGTTVMADLIVNHVSAQSHEFINWLRHGKNSEYEGLFLTFDRVFPSGATEQEISAFYRPRPGLPFTPYRSADGHRHLVWTTFMPSQVDIDVTHPAGEAYLRRVIAALARGGVTIVRVDAVGYAIKTPGTDSFMTKETLDFVAKLTDMCHEHGLEVLVEVHAHYQQQQQIAAVTDLVYDFATPALILHSFVSGSIEPLAHWCRIRPHNTVTVLDTHDGIGIIDAGPIGQLPGLITENDMAAIFDWAAENTNGDSLAASVVPEWFSLPHQINSTYFHTLGCNPQRYIFARAIQMFLPGVPQIYYVGLLAGKNDVVEWKRTGNGRDINRHRFTDDEVNTALKQEIVQTIMALVKMRTYNPAFAGHFSFAQLGRSVLELQWTHGPDTARLVVNAADASFEITLNGPTGQHALSSCDDLLSFDRDNLT